MPLSADDFVHENNGAMSSPSTSIVVSLAGADSTTAGNTVFVFMSLSSAVTVTPPSGFVQDASTGSGGLLAFRKSEVAAAETSWTFTAASVLATWYVVEMSNVDSADPLDANTGSGAPSSTANGGTRSTGTTVINAGLSSAQFAVFFSLRVTSGSTQSWSGYTNGFEEVVDNPGTATSGAPTIAVARNFRDGSTSTFESTATFASSGGSANTAAMMVAYRAANSPVVAPLAGIWGFEWGTHGGFGLGGATSLCGYSVGATGTFGTNYLVQAGSARNSSYGLRIVNTAGNGGIAFGNLGASSGGFAFNVRVISATGTVIVARFDNSTGLYVLYDSSTNKFGLRWGPSGTPSWQTGTTALNTWTYIQVRAKSNTATYHCEWWIEADGYQTSPADDTTAGSSSNFALLLLGSSATLSDPAQTVTADFDDVITSRYYTAWPLGVHQVRLVVPETTGASVSGTSTNFSKFTANGTLAAWASDAGSLIDEVPPTVSASSDGVVQTAVAASDYMQFPMTTYTLAYNEAIAAVRAYFAEWGGTGTGTGTIGYRGYDGTTETTLQAASASYDADSLTAISATYPRWMAAMWPSANGWTQTELNAAALRVGFSTDATPDMGISAAYLEVAIKTVDAVRQLTAGENEATADIYVHPYTSATVSYVITNNSAEKTYEFGYSLAGTPQTPVTVTASSSQTLQLNADAFGDVSDTYLTPL